jgi:hypothetical protein
MDSGKIVHDSLSTAFSGTEDFRHTYMSLVCRDTDTEGITNL